MFRFVLIPLMTVLLSPFVANAQWYRFNPPTHGMLVQSLAGAMRTHINRLAGEIGKSGAEIGRVSDKAKQAGRELSKNEKDHVKQHEQRIKDARKEQDSLHKQLEVIGANRA